MSITALRTILLAALLVSGAAAADDEAVQFIDKTVITYPLAVGGYTFMGQSYNPDQLVNGLALEYGIKDAPPGTRLDLFVYPIGRVDPQPTLSKEMDHVTVGLRHPEMMKTRSDVRIEPITDISIPVAASPDLQAPTKAATVDAGPAKPAGEESGLETFMSKMAVPVPTPGKRMEISFVTADVPRRSLAYVFYRNLYLIKIRLTAEASLLSQSAFDEMGDAVARELVPAIDVQNFGTCGNIVIPEDKSNSAKRDPDAGAKALFAGMLRVQRENCASAPGKLPEIVPSGVGFREIVFPAGFWKASE